MKISIVLTPTKSKFSPMFYAGNLEHGMKKASELGYDGVELNIRDSSKVDQNKIIQLSKDYNLNIISMGTGQAYYEEGISLASADSNIQEKTYSRLKDHIDFANKMGSQVVLGSIRGKFGSNKNIRKKQENKAYETVKKCVKYAEESDVTLTIESINYQDTNFINTTYDAIDYINKFSSDNIKLLIDTFQLELQGENINDSIKKAKDLLVHIHLVDSDRKIPGQGNIDFKEVIKYLKDVNYRGFLSAEIIPLPNDDTAAKEYIDAVRELIK